MADTKGNTEIYISFTPNNNMVFIFSAKDDRVMNVSKITLNPKYYEMFEINGNYEVSDSSIDNRKNLMEEIENSKQREKQKETLISGLKTEIESHFSRDFTINKEELVDNTQIVSSIKRMEIEKNIKNHWFWLDALWMRVFRMTKTDLYMLLGYDMEFHCMGTGGNSVFNLPISFDERIMAMFSKGVGKYKRSYGLIDDYSHFIKPYRDRMIQLINDCYIVIDNAIENGSEMKNIIFSYKFKEAIIYSDYLLYVKTILSDYLEEDFASLNFDLIAKHKNNFIKEMRESLYLAGSSTVEVLSMIFETTPYPYIKTRVENNRVYYEWLNEDNIAI